MMWRTFLAGGLLLVLPAGAAHAVTTDLTIQLDGGKSTLVVTRQAASEWTCTIEGVKHRLTIKGEAVACYRGDALAARGTVHKGKVVLDTSDGAFFARLKLQADKTKLQFSEDGATWEFKTKGEKIKVRVGDKSYGKVKHYPDTGKTKAKDADEHEKAVCRQMDRAYAALGVFLIPDLKPPKRELLMLVLFALGR